MVNKDIVSPSTAPVLKPLMSRPTAQCADAQNPPGILPATDRLANALGKLPPTVAFIEPTVASVAPVTTGPAPEFADVHPEPEIAPHSFVIHGKIAGKFARILVDTGCNTMMINDKWVRRHRVSTYQPATPINVEWGDDGGVFTSTRMYCGDVSLWCQGGNVYQHHNQPFIVTPLHVDAILGLPFILALVDLHIFAMEDGRPGMSFTACNR